MRPQRVATRCNIHGVHIGEAAPRRSIVTSFPPPPVCPCQNAMLLATPDRNDGWISGYCLFSALRFPHMYVVPPSMFVAACHSTMFTLMKVGRGLRAFLWLYTNGSRAHWYPSGPIVGTSPTCCSPAHCKTLPGLLVHPCISFQHKAQRWPNVWPKRLRFPADLWIAQTSVF
jgi:hypothetical protein